MSEFRQWQCLNTKWSEKTSAEPNAFGPGKVVAQLVALTGWPIGPNYLIRPRLVVKQLVCQSVAPLVLLPFLRVGFDFFPGPIDRTKLLGLK